MRMACPLIGVVALLAGCADGVPVSVSAIQPSATNHVDCAAVAELTPAQAHAELTASGYDVVWRVDATADDGQILSAAPSDVPMGEIGDIVINDTVVTIFVSPEGDPLHESYPEDPTCHVDV